MPSSLHARITRRAISPRLATSTFLNIRVRGRRADRQRPWSRDRKSTRLNSSHSQISYAVFCLKKKKKKQIITVETCILITSTQAYSDDTTVAVTTEREHDCSL